VGRQVSCVLARPRDLLGRKSDENEEAVPSAEPEWGYLGLLPSQLGAHQIEIQDACLPNNPERTFLADKLRYLLKSPQKAYRVYKTSRITKNGELVPCLRQRKSELRKGDRITLFHLMKNLRLGELAVAGGEGTDLMRRIKRRAVLVRGPRAAL
jgi:hypothetical protein